MSRGSNLPSGYLEAYLAPLAGYIARADICDIFINGPGEVWTETIDGACECHAVPELGEAELWRLARQIAAASDQGISREHPLLSASLPGGLRVQIVAPPATRHGPVFAFRKHLMPNLTLADYLASGAFEGTSLSKVSSFPRGRVELPSQSGESQVQFLESLVQGRRNILISGGTSSGKTTFLNALLREVPARERLILIEDTPEVVIDHANAVALLAAKGELAEAQVTADDLLEAALRLRPDRIILGEVRGAEAYAYLRTINTGHPGSITTIHADSAEGALEQLALIILQTGVQLGREDILHYARGVIDVVIQLERGGAGRRGVREILLTR